MRNALALLIAIAAGIASQLVVGALDLEGLAAYGVFLGFVVLVALTAVPLSVGLGRRSSRSPAREGPTR